MCDSRTELKLFLFLSSVDKATLDEITNETKLDYFKIVKELNWWLNFDLITKVDNFYMVADNFFAAIFRDVAKHRKFCEDRRDLKMASKIMLFLSSVKKTTIGRIIGETNFERSAVMKILNTGIHYKLLREADGFYYTNDGFSFNDFEFFIKDVLFDFWYSRLPSRNKGKNEETVVQPVAKKLEAPRKIRSDNVRTSEIRRRRHLGGGSSMAGGGGNGMPHFEWNTSTALDFYHEMERIRAARRSRAVQG